MVKEKEEINFFEIEKKWQKKWEEAGCFAVKEQKNKKKFYVLEMYPYPSGSGLHVGHAFNYTIGDIYARFKRMQGFNVLYPMGYDSFGLPAENAAIKTNVHPKIYTDKAISNFVLQQKSLGFSYDWSRKIESHDKNYYKWDQYFFLQFFKNGLVYRKSSPVNYCSKCNSVLANEQVHNGRCWVHKETEIEIKHLEQWFVKITKYAEELYNEIDSLDWPEKIKSMQKNWIGKSEGIEIKFKINGEEWPIFTTRPDTIYGVTFMVISAQHPKLMKIVTKEQKADVEKFLRKIKSTSEKDSAELEKEGAFTGSYAINPINGEKIPVWTGNFVVADYGCGMVMAVPAHDQRDFEFAKKYGIPIKLVISPKKFDLKLEDMKKAFVDEGVLINSDKFNGLNSKEAIVKISDYLEEKKIGRRTVNYKLRDWLISRQRYWGAPIPIIYCENCGLVPVSEKDLPVLLPEKVTFGKGNPLTTNDTFVNTKCIRCNGKAKRETDTMDTFFESSWYFLRFTDPHNKKEPFSKEKTKYWMPVDFYVGGAEHACMHLIYARFFTKALRDLGYFDFGEPFKKLFNQGMIHGEDGAVMSKSRGNVIDPLEISSKYGVDTLRFFLVSMSSPDKDFSWSSEGIESIAKFLLKMYLKLSKIRINKSSSKISHKVNKCVKEVSANIENLQYNLAIIKIRFLVDELEEEISREDFEKIVKILSPFCPHIAEELWEKIGGEGFVSVSSWPLIDESKINPEIDDKEKKVDKIIRDIFNVLKMVEMKEGKEAEKVYLYVLPNEMSVYDKTLIEKKVSKKLEIFAVNDKKKYDPSGKSAKAKPGKPGIYIE